MHTPLAPTMCGWPELGSDSVRVALTRWSRRPSQVALQASNLVLNFLSTLAIAAPVYILVGFQVQPDKVAVFVLVLVLMALIGSCLGVTVGTITSGIDAARTAIIPMILPLLLFAGYLIPLDQIPVYFQWAYYASFFQYSLGLLQVNELTGRNFTQDCPRELASETAEELIHKLYPDIPLPPIPNVTCSGEEYLAQEKLWPVPYGGIQGYFLILTLYFVVFFVLAYVALAIRLRQHR